MFQRGLGVLTIAAALATPAAPAGPAPAKPPAHSDGRKIPDFAYAGRIDFRGFRHAPLFPFVTDYDNDGKADLTYFSQDGELYLYLNKGTKAEPTFDYAGYLEDSKGPRYHGYRIIAYNTGEPYGRSVHQFVDWNNDGKKDLVFGTTEDVKDWGWVYVWLNSGTDERPFFEDAAKGTSIMRKYGLPDNVGAGTPLLGDSVGLIETTDGKFINVEPCTSGELGISPWVADWDRDGKKDLLVGASGHKPGHVRFYRNIGTDAAPRFSPNCLTLTAAKRELLGAHPVVADLDRDGKPELLLMTQEGVTVFRKRAGDDADLEAGQPALSSGQPIPYQRERGSMTWLGEGFPRTVAADWNDDGRMDLIRGTGSDTQVEVYLALDGSGRSYGEKLRVSAKDFPPRNTLLFDVVDYDADGRKDLVIGAKYGLQHGVFLKWFPNVGTNAAPRFDIARGLNDFGIVGTLRRSNSIAPYFVDYDNDGDQDLIVTTGGSTGGICYFPNTAPPSGEPCFAKNPKARDWRGGLLALDTNWGMYRFPVLVDWDFDGKKDMICSWYQWNKDNSSILFLKNTGTDDDPAFSLPPEEITPWLGTKKPTYPQVVDLNSDGKIDLVTGDWLGKLRYYENIGERGKTPRLADAIVLKADGGEIERSKMTWGDGLMTAPLFKILDWNEDGILDILQADEWGNLHLYLGQNNPMQTCADLGARERPIGWVSRGNLVVPARDTPRCSYSDCYKPEHRADPAAKTGN
ncbi:MAG TPA: VCBS repeat-containing protein [Planctomycetota bacterium]|nr:VCBS repeat-containing protein [Planctomycetota bacterium]